MSPKMLGKMLLTLICFTAVLFHSSNAAITTTSSPSLPTGEVCRSQGCLKAATYLKSSMDPKANPCTDFYSFACGAWRDNTKHPIPEDSTSVGAFDGLEEQMADTIRTELAKDLANDVTSSRSVKYSSNLYHRCVHSVNNGSEVDGLKELKQVMHQILGGDWFIGQSNASHDHSANWTQIFSRALSNGGPNGVPGFLVSFDSSVEGQGHSRKLMLSPGRFEMTESVLRNLSATPKLVQVYREAFTDLGRLFCGNDCAQLKEDVEALIELQAQLVQVKLPVEQQRDPELLYEITTLGKLSNQTNLDWNGQIYQSLIQSLVNSSHPELVNDSSPILLKDPTYIKASVAILQQTPSRVLHNLIGLGIVKHYGEQVSGRVRSVLQTIEHATEGRAKPPSTEEQCYYFTNAVIPWANGRIFLDRSFSAKEKRVASELVDQIFLSFEAELRRNQWLDEKTRVRALAKVHAIKRNVAYPEWMMNNTQLDAFHYLTDETVFHELTNTKDNGLLQSVLKHRRNLMRKDLWALKEASSFDQWKYTPATINAFYNPFMNSINMLAGILKYPFFEADNPFAMNFGGIGVAMAHEITHGFDDVGRKYDEVGAIANWWTAEAEARFRNLSDCFVRQYSAAVDPDSGLHVNGVFGLGENIADNGGVKVAFQAFQDRTKRNGHSPRLAGLEQFTPEQLFFISYANNWCQNIRPEVAKQLILLDAHSPGVFRTNIPLSNFAEFGQAFHCPANSPMNPTKRCAVW